MPDQRVRKWLTYLLAFGLGMLSFYGLSHLDTLTGSGSKKQVAIAEQQQSTVTIARNLSPAIVGIINYSRTGDFFSRKTVEKNGSGVIVDSSGYIVTNNHVVEGATRLVVVLPNGKQLEAKLVGRDPRSDIAVVKISGSGYRTASLGDSSKLKVGESVVAIGNPLGLRFARSVTAGVVSGLNRVIDTEQGYLMRLIQTDAAINPGNSGGALANTRGEVIGINTVKISVQGFEGMGFAIPSNQVKDVVKQIREYGRVKRPAMGVKMVREIASEDARFYRLPVDSGILVEPLDGSIAAKAGLKANDIILSIDGHPVKSMDDLQEYVWKCKVGQNVTLEIMRLPENGGQPQTRKVTVCLCDENDLR